MIKNLLKFIWINGKILDSNEYNIDLLTHSLHYSGAVFEGERAYNGRIFKLNEHTKRLLESAKLMHLKLDYSIEQIEFATKSVIEQNNIKNAYIRPLIWKESDSLGLYHTNFKTNLLILAIESNPKFRNDLRLSVGKWRKISENAIPVQAKSSTHYGMACISQQIAQNMGYDDALLLDQYDNIAECSVTNIFFGNTQKMELFTPIADRFLNGITRQFVIKIAKNMGIKVTEKRVRLKDLEEYDTCFVTGTSAEIRGVLSVDNDHTSFKFINDKITIILQEEFAKITGKEL